MCWLKKIFFMKLNKYITFKFSLGVIRLLHDSSFKQNIEHCSTKDCYHLGIRYANSMDEIEAVIRVSNSCEQRIQVRKVQITSILCEENWNFSLGNILFSFAKIL